VHIYATKRATIVPLNSTIGGVSRTRLSTTVDSELLREARRAHDGDTDAQLIDAALSAFVAQRRAAAIDAAYGEAYAAQPIEQPDKWGDLASFRQAAASS
jgi:hypothetical protein